MVCFDSIESSKEITKFYLKLIFFEDKTRLSEGLCGCAQAPGPHAGGSYDWDPFAEANPQRRACNDG